MADGTNYAIMRCEKRKTWGEISGLVAHAMRSIPTLNANPDLKHLNGFIRGEKKDPMKRIRDLVDTCYQTEASVKCLEYIMTATPEWWIDATKEQQGEWFRNSMAFLENKHGKENIALAVVHQDEHTTPHISAFVVPREAGTYRSKKTKLTYDFQLNAKRFTAGRKMMSDMQTEYHNYVKHLGLERGEIGSKATHQRVDKHYGALAKADKMAKLTAREIAKLAFKGDLDSINDALAAANAQAQVNKFETIGLRSGNAKLTARNEHLQKQSDEMKKQLDEVRNTDLAKVADALGLVQSEKDGYYRHPEQDVKINIEGQKFYDLKASHGRAGAFDLAMHVMQCDFATAKAWCLDTFGQDAYVDMYKKQAIAQKADTLESEAVKSAKQTATDLKTKAVVPYVKPEPVAANWPKVRKYLHLVRRIPEQWLDVLHKRNAIYADSRNNIVFAIAKGAFRRGTVLMDDGSVFRGWAAGSKKDEGWTATMGKGDAVRDNLIVCENPLDGLSYLQLHKIKGTVCSTFGIANALPDNVRNKAWKRIIVAYDNDKAGQLGASKLAAACENAGHKNTFIHLPNGAKDWNEVLQMRSKEKRPQGSPVSRVQFNKGYR